jgi:hypothetical protein
MMKLKLFLYLIVRYVTKTNEVVYVRLRIFLTSVLERGELSAENFALS